MKQGKQQQQQRLGLRSRSFNTSIPSLPESSSCIIPDQFSVNQVPQSQSQPIPVNPIKPKNPPPPPAMREFPATEDLYSKMPTDRDLLGNDQYGDCAEVSLYRSIEVLTYRAEQNELIVDTELVLSLYSAVTGFDKTQDGTGPGPDNTNPTDNGTIYQQLLDYYYTTGIPLPNSTTPTKITGFFELTDLHNLSDIKRAIYECGGIFIGITCYSNFMDNSLESFGGRWEWKMPSPTDEQIGGHAIYCGWYDEKGFWIKSWGADIYVSNHVLTYIADEMYCIVSPLWFDVSGRNPFGKTESEIESLMAGYQSDYVSMTTT